MELTIIDEVKEMRDRLLWQRQKEKGGPDYAYTEGVLDVTNELIKRYNKVQ